MMGYPFNMDQRNYKEYFVVVCTLSGKGRSAVEAWPFEALCNSQLNPICCPCCMDIDMDLAASACNIRQSMFVNDGCGAGLLQRPDG